MERVQVSSTSIASVGYEIETSTLEVEFQKSGGIYQYFGVPQHLHEGLMQSGSKGSFFQANIRNAGYSYMKVG
jgi:KTSC domain